MAVNDSHGVQQRWKRSGLPALNISAVCKQWMQVTMTSKACSSSRGVDGVPAYLALPEGLGGSIPKAQAPPKSSPENDSPRAYSPGASPASGVTLKDSAPSSLLRGFNPYSTFP